LSENFKGPLGRPTYSWDDNIKMALTEIECGSGDWVKPAHERSKCQDDVNTAVESLVSIKVGNFLTRQVTMKF